MYATEETLIGYEAVFMQLDSQLTSGFLLSAFPPLRDWESVSSFLFPFVLM